jgi:hypothetical protein
MSKQIIGISFTISQLHYKVRFENLAKELKVSTIELMRLAMIQYLNREIETCNINELEMFSKVKKSKFSKYKTKFIQNEY